jgi:menaquinone-dependent protoporphyrinogen oxidase
MNVLVACASRHGATRGIAERIASTLEQRGVEVNLCAVTEAADVSRYDGIVIGSAAYAFHWLKEATEFVRRHSQVLADRPVWVFSSGPLGKQTDAEGNDARVKAEPREFREIRDAIQPRDMRVFFGAYDPNAAPIGLMERVTHLMPAARDALPAGDYRDWAAIDVWANDIASELSVAYSHA